MRFFSFFFAIFGVLDDELRTIGVPLEGDELTVDDLNC